MDGDVIKTVRAKHIQIHWSHIALAFGQLDRVLAERDVGRRERSPLPIAGDGMDELIGSLGAIELVVDLSTEVVGM